ncbi:MAG: transglutaminase family protein [Chloroflexi bacterium]|nr:transglutaminase family protein [Chloroflexota bacterium]
MLEKTWRYKTLAILVSLTLVLQLSLPGWSLMTTAQGSDDPPAVSQSLSPSVSNLQSPVSPLSISRHQSTYQAGSTVLITYTLSNNQPVTVVPDISETATITDTVAALAGFDLTADPNSIREVSLETTLTAAATYLSSSLPPTPSGNTYTWQLPDLPPQSSLTFTLTVQGPATAANFTDLDTGAILSGTLWDLSESATARPAMLAPISLGSTFLRRTPDADLTDSEMLWFAAAYSQDPLTSFAQVRGMAYEAYPGSLRGTRGTLWNNGGNSADQSSLLIAMLRSAGIPARYRHGSLSPATAQTLIASMFPANQGSPVICPPDPPPIPSTIRLSSRKVQDRWWVEAYLPGSGWTNLDPRLPTPTPRHFRGDGCQRWHLDRIAELPASTRHTLTVRLTRVLSRLPHRWDPFSHRHPLTCHLQHRLPGRQTAHPRPHRQHRRSGRHGFATITHDYTPT